MDATSGNESQQGHSIFENVPLGGLEIAVSHPQAAAVKLCTLAANISNKSGVSIHLVNAYTISLAARDRNYADVLARSSGNLPDGKPLVWISNLKGRPLWQVRGPSLFGNVMDIGRNSNVKHFLLGSTNDTLRKLNEELTSRYPGIEIVGQLSPPFRDQSPSELAAQDKFISDSEAQIVWVGLGTPKQDFEVLRLANRLPVVAVAVGAAFDFVAGTKKEAPVWIRKIGFEWLFRLLSEPRRLWRRYLFGNFEFLRATLRNGRSS
ncbi:WecB/TagA/CpsF family glycosyltransferase [Arthrobacter gyeryongensis]